MIEIITPQRRISARGQHLENTTGQAQDRNIKSTAAEIENGIDALRGIVQAIRDGGSRRFIQQTQHMQPCELRRILGGLALCIVKISRHGDYRAGQLPAKRSFGSHAQGFENFCRDLHRTFDARCSPDPDHAFGIDKIVGEGFDMLNIGAATPHETLDGNNGVARIARLPGFRRIPYFNTLRCGIAHDRRQQRAAGFIVEYDAHTAAHRSDK